MMYIYVYLKELDMEVITSQLFFNNKQYIILMFKIRKCVDSIKIENLE